VVGNVIRKLRLARKMSQSELANRSCLSQSFIHYIEEGKKSPTVRTLEKLATGLGVHPSILLAEALKRSGTPPVE